MRNVSIRERLGKNGLTNGPTEATASRKSRNARNVKTYTKKTKGWISQPRASARFCAAYFRYL